MISWRESPGAHSRQCRLKDIMAMVGLCPDHFKLDVMTYVP